MLVGGEFVFLLPVNHSGNWSESYYFVVVVSAYCKLVNIGYSYIFQGLLNGITVKFINTHCIYIIILQLNKKKSHV